MKEKEIITKLVKALGCIAEVFERDLGYLAEGTKTKLLLDEINSLHRETTLMIDSESKETQSEN